VALGGEAVVLPFVVSGVARIALILDSVGALVGLWQPIESGLSEDADE
jgi:predicted enzyme related to lactoylglutathione lyase